MIGIRATRLLLFTLAGLLLVVSASAQVKMAIINSQKALLDTAEIKKAQADLEARFKPRTDQVAKLESDLQTIQSQLQTMQGKLTPQAEQEMMVQGQRKQRELTRLREDLQADVDRERNDILQRSSLRMQEVVKKLAEAAGVDVVVDVSNTVYFKPALEITVQVTEAYNKAYPSK